MGEAAWIQVYVPTEPWCLFIGSTTVISANSKDWTEQQANKQTSKQTDQQHKQRSKQATNQSSKQAIQQEPTNKRTNRQTNEHHSSKTTQTNEQPNQQTNKPQTNHKQTNKPAGGRLPGARGVRVPLPALAESRPAPRFQSLLSCVLLIQSIFFVSIACSGLCCVEFELMSEMLVALSWLKFKLVSHD